MKLLILSVLFFLALLGGTLVFMKSQTQKIAQISPLVGNSGQINSQPKSLTTGLQKGKNSKPQLQPINQMAGQSFSGAYEKLPAPIDKVNRQQYNNFFQDAVVKEGRIFRWNKFNLYYYIDLSAQRRIRSKIKRAFELWQRKGRLFNFIETADKSKADIFVEVSNASEKDRMGEGGPDKAIESGEVYTFGGKKVIEYTILHARITISQDFFDYKQIQRYQVQGVDHGFQTMVHEIGHILGIMGHSPKVGDCMYFQADPSGKACDAITPEANTLAMIYGKPHLLAKY